MAGPRTRLPVRLSAVILLAPLHCTRTPPSAVLPQVSADSVDRSCWRATVRFSVSLRVGSSGLLGDLAGDSGLHPADEREEAKGRLATKTLGPSMRVLTAEPAAKAVGAPQVSQNRPIAEYRSSTVGTAGPA